jgi:acyl-CoA synthetase (NDP forming)
MTEKDRKQIDRLFNPRGLALFGGVATAISFGRRFMDSQMLYGYKGAIYPISEKGGQVSGIKVYKNLDEVPGPIDLAALSVPARAVPGILRECLKKGLAGVQIHSSGFSETAEPEGIALEAEIAEIAAQGLRVVGPNCFGLHSPKGGITLLPGYRFSKESGPVAMISQSGGVGADFGYEALDRGLGLSKIASYGNGCDLDALELLDYLADDPDTEIIAAYLEGVRQGSRFLELLKKVTPRKPVVVWKGGLTPLGSRATISHTGSLGGQAKIWQGALNQAGVVSVQGLEEMMDALVALKYLRNQGRRIALLGGGGAIGVFSSDLAYRWGLEIPPFSPETQKRLRAYFPTPGNSMINPLDTGTPVLPMETVEALSREILTREPIDVLIVILLLRPLEADMPNFMRLNGLEPPPRGSYFEGLLPGLVRLKEETGKDIVMVFENKAYLEEDVFVEGVSRNMRGLYLRAGIPVYPSAERALRGIRHGWEGTRTGLRGGTHPEPVV